VNWRWKARAQRLLAGLPLSDQLYYGVQNSVGSLRPGRLTAFDWFESGANVVARARTAGREIAGKRFIEVGTGRHLCVPTGLWLCGAAQTLTVDLNRYLSETVVARCLRYLSENRDEVWELFGSEAQAPLFDERFRRLTAFSGGLPEYLRLIDTSYVAPADAAKLAVPDHSFDFHISHVVFEHVPPEALREILDEARRVLVPQGLLVHLIDLSDHYSHADASISAVNFLQFDDAKWARLAGNKFAYVNRLRGYEHVELFEQAGVQIVGHRQTLDQRSLETLRNGFELAARYRNVDPEQLAVTSVNLTGTFASSS
jgi:SAM-dependent methyltransferase